MNEKPKSRVWMWILGGCLVLVVVVAGVLVGVFFWGRQTLTTMVEEQTKPEVRETRAKETLGATALPPGYRAGINVSMGIVRSLRLGDSADGTSVEKRGFVYHEFLRASESEMDDFLAGKSNILDEMGTRVRADERLRDAIIEVNGKQIHYYVQRGEITDSDAAMPALITVMTFQCAGEDRERWGIWFQKEAAATPTAQVDVDGSVGDEKAIRAFVGHFNVCRK